MVAVAEQSEEWLLAGSLRGRDDGEDDSVEGNVAELSRRGKALFPSLAVQQFARLRVIHHAPEASLAAARSEN